MAHVAVATRKVNEPRAYQHAAIDATVADLDETKGSLTVVPTGGGKTLIMGNVADRKLDQNPDLRVMVLQHTGELVAQNYDAISSIVAHRDVTVSVVKAKRNDWDGQIIFACTPTLSRKKRRAKMPKIDLLLVDEGHRLGTSTCKHIVADLRRANPDLEIASFTATPNRSDGQTLAYAVGEGVSYQITYAELIDLGVLVPPRTFTIDLGLNAEIEALPKHAGDFDMETIGLLLNRQVHNEAVYEHWLERASDRQTIGFCPTVQHAKAIAETFRQKGVVAEAIWGDMNADLRTEILERYEAGTIQVLFNCLVLIEGYDAPRTSCIILLRPMVEQLTFLQGVGRGLRTLDPEIYPDEIKLDCVLLDFTGAADRHGTLELLIMEEREAKIRARSEPKAELDNVIDMEPAKKKLRHFTMREIELISAPNQPLVFGDMVCEHAIAHNNYAWAGVFVYEGTWHAIGRTHNQTVQHLGAGDRLDTVTLVDAFLRKDQSGRMPKDIREAPVTAEQKFELVRWLINPMAIETNYEAICRLSVAKAAPQIKALLADNHNFQVRLAA